MLVSERVLRVFSVQIGLVRSRGAFVAEDVTVAVLVLELVGEAVLVAVPFAVALTEAVTLMHDAISPVGADASSARMQLLHSEHEKGVRGSSTTSGGVYGKNPIDGMVRVPKMPSEMDISPTVTDMFNPPDKLTATRAPGQRAAGRASKTRYGLTVKVMPHEFHSENSREMSRLVVSDAVPGNESDTGRCRCTA